MSARDEAVRLHDEGWTTLQEGRVAEGLAALQQAALVVHDDAALAGRILARIALAHDYLGDPQAAIEANVRALHALEQTDDHDSHIICRYSLGHRYLMVGRVDLARAYITEAADLARRIGNTAQLGNALVNLGNCHMAEGALEPADEAYAAALVEFEKIDDPAGRAAALTSRGNVRQAMRRLDEARDFYLPALAAASHAGRWTATNDARINLARVVYELGDVAEAARWFEQARDEARDNGHLVRQAGCAYDLGLMRENLGEIEAAIAAYHESWQIFARVGPPEREAALLRILVNACRRSDHPERLLPLRRRALQLARRYGDASDVLELLDNIGITCLVTGDVQRALDYWENALCLARRIGGVERQIPILENLRRLYEHRGRPDLGVAHAEALVRAYRAVGDGRAEAWTLHDLGQLLIVCGQGPASFEALTEAERLARETGDGLLQGVVHGTRANAHLALGQIAESLASYQHAVSLLEAAEHRGAQAVTLSNMALAYEAAGEPVRAHACLRDAARLRSADAADPAPP